MGGELRLWRTIALTIIGTLALLGMAGSTLFAAEVMQCQDFPDGVPQDVRVVDGLISKEFISDLTVHENGLAYALCAGSNIYFIARSGRFVQAYNFDNGPDYFSKDEGLARYIGANGLIGFVDRDLNIVIAARYSAASRFEFGLAHVSVHDGNSVFEGWINTHGQHVQR